MLDLSKLDAALPVSRTASLGTPLNLPMSQLVEDPANPRTHFDVGSLQALAEDIRVRGILQPIIVRPADAAGRHMIQFGARRFRAGQIAGLATFPCFVATDQRQFGTYAQVSENHQRENLSPLEMAQFIAGRLAAGEKKKDIAKGLGISATALTFLCALIEPPDFLLQLYHAGQCRTPEYLYKLRNLREQHGALVEERVSVAPEIGRAWVDQLAADLNPPAAMPAPVIPHAITSPETPAVAAHPTAEADATATLGRDPVLARAAAPARRPGAKYKVIVVADARQAVLLLDRHADEGSAWIRHLDDGSEELRGLAALTLHALTDS
jgi:ParB family chromosome partitioning protein